MVQLAVKIRFLLCEPSDKKRPQGQNIFYFEGKAYVVHSIHRDIEEAKEFSRLFTVEFLIAKISFPETEKLNNSSPYEFLNWESPAWQNPNTPRL